MSLVHGQEPVLPGEGVELFAIPVPPRSRASRFGTPGSARKPP